jgi:hypothetical protein
MLMKSYQTPTATITSTKVITTQPNKYVVHTNPIHNNPVYNPYKAQYYN